MIGHALCDWADLYFKLAGHGRTFRGQLWMAGSHITVRGLVPTGPRTDKVSDMGVGDGDALKYIYLQ